METLRQTIDADFVTARKEKKQFDLIVLGDIREAINEEERNQKRSSGSLPDNQIVEIINKLIKARAKAIASVEVLGRATGHAEFIEGETRAKELLQAYVTAFQPTQMSDGEIESAIGAIAITIGDGANPGRVMGEFSKQYKGKADMKRVSEIVRQQLV